MEKIQWNDRVRQLIDERKWSMPRLAEAMGKKGNASLIARLHKYFPKPGSKTHQKRTRQARDPVLIEELAKAFGVAERYITHGDDNLSKSATFNDIVAVNGATKESSTSEPKPVSLPLIPHEQLVGQEDLPVYSATQGGPGVIIVSNDAVEYVARPAPLAKVAKGYGVIVIDDLMVPEFRSNDIVLVHPHLIEKAGDTCVFISHQPDGATVSMIKHLVRKTDEKYYVREWNSPGGGPRDFSLKRTEWQECHVSVGRYTRR